MKFFPQVLRQRHQQIEIQFTAAKGRLWCSIEAIYNMLCLAIKALIYWRYYLHFQFDSSWNCATSSSYWNLVLSSPNYQAVQATSQHHSVDHHVAHSLSIQQQEWPVSACSGGCAALQAWTTVSNTASLTDTKADQVCYQGCRVLNKFLTGAVIPIAPQLINLSQVGEG